MLSFVVGMILLLDQYTFTFAVGCRLPVMLPTCMKLNQQLQYLPLNSAVKMVKKTQQEEEKIHTPMFQTITATL